jgi:chromosome segregation protein
MHLKRLEISGFKSFADSIKLDLEPGITAVVGPNGCGKSNIIDAVRWCLGEMSAKSLRSSMMLDVVFNGSGSRPPQNMAEVTLTFDNTDKRLPIDFSDVSITRRLFRSGESEYYINRTQCRLRDIKELFLDTGMGEDGYSSLEQGKVEWILQAKPEERRELFEEAAGVSKYRARREEALRKLEKVEVDLSRIADILLVTDDQIRKLENAVNRAKTYERIKEELRVMEVGDWLHHITSGSTEMTTLEEQVTQSQKSAEELNTQVHQQDAQVSEHRLALTQFEEELLNANTALNQIDSEIKISEERLRSSKQRQHDIEQQRLGAEANKSREQNRSSELESQLVQLNQALKELRASGLSFQTDFDSAKNKFDETSRILEQKKNAVRELREAMATLEQRRQRAQNELAQANADISRLDVRAESLQRDQDRHSADAAETLRQIEETGVTVEALRRQLAEKNGVLDSLSASLSDDAKKEIELRLRISSAGEDIARLQGQIESTRDIQSHDPYLAGANAVIAQGFEGISGPLARLIKTEPLHHDLVAATLGEHLSDLVAETAEDAQRAISYLRESQNGRARIWILDRLEALPRQGLGDLGAGTYLATYIQSDPKHRGLIEHLVSSHIVQGHDVFASAFINGGTDPSSWKSHVSHRLPEWEKQLETLESQKKTWEAESAELHAEIVKLTHDKEAARRETDGVKIQLEVLLQGLGKMTQRKQSLENETQALALNVERVRVDKQAREEQTAQLNETLAALVNESLGGDERVQTLQTELMEFQQSHAQASAHLVHHEERLKGFNERLKWQQSLITQHTNERATLLQNIQWQDQRLTELQASLEHTLAQEAQSQQTLDHALSERQAAAERCADIQKKRTVLSEQIREADGRLHSLRSQLQTAQETSQSLLIHQTGLKNRLEATVQKLQDQYEMTVDAAKEKYAPQPADVETLEKLKKRVANIGPINLAAPQEHAELVEKNTFLSTQQNDLIKAKDDLKQVIAKINATTRDHFRETFEKVRENFRGLYGRLFQGGEADLRFTDENDILNTGIDIFCQPPGKKLLHISLLSGGEKALTAIALLFAFFQVRPSPLALMDEVDAPLDEANVMRYVDMLKAFSEKSQFLLISHNKRTMEAANSLYGVTMEELGVSKVISARLLKKQAAATPAPAAPETKETATASA